MLALGFDNSQEALFCRWTVRFKFMAACDSTAILRRLAAGRKEKPKWKFAAGREFPGLVKRRTRERALCDAGLS